jgi:hypothetical protein
MLIQAIDKYLKSRARDKRLRECFHPSSLHKSASELYQAYFDGDSKEFPPRVLRIFDNGHHVHQRLQTYLTEMGILKQAEVPVFNREYDIKGICDGIIRIGGKKGVLEIKSMNQNQFYSLHEPKRDHLVQINVYMFSLGIPRGVLLYECKNDQELKTFFVKQDESILNPILEKIKYLQECIKEGVKPSTKGAQCYEEAD